MSMISPRNLYNNAIRLMMIFIVLAAIMGSFHLFKLFQNELLLANSNYSIPTIIKNIILAYFIPVFSVTFATSYFVILGYLNISLKITIKKAFIFAFFITFLLPGFVYFPEAYELNYSLYAFYMSVIFVIIVLARLLKNFTEEELSSMKFKLKNFVHKE